MEIDISKVYLNNDEIKKYIPHRDPLLLLDVVHQFEEGKKIVTSKILKETEPVFAGHFPHAPIYPGVYFAEAIAQSGAILYFISHLSKTDQSNNIGVLTSIDSARFKKPAFPGNQIVYDVSIKKSKGPFIWFTGAAYIDNKLAMECELSIAVTANPYIKG